MDMKIAEQVADSPGVVDDATRRQAYNYLESRVNDKSLSEQFRQKANIARNKIFNWAYQKACAAHPVSKPKPKKSRI